MFFSMVLLGLCFFDRKMAAFEDQQFFFPIAFSFRPQDAEVSSDALEGSVWCCLIGESSRNSNQGVLKQFGILKPWWYLKHGYPIGCFLFSPSVFLN